MRKGSTFLFVNKHAGSERLSQSRGSERSNIFSHVQRIYDIDDSVASSEPWHIVQLPADRRHDTSSNKTRYTGRTPEVKKRVRTTGARSKKTQVHRRLPSHTPCIPPSLQTLGGTNADPFDNYDSAITPRVHHLFSICEVAALTEETINDIANRTMQTRAILRLFFSRANLSLLHKIIP